MADNKDGQTSGKESLTEGSNANSRYVSRRSTLKVLGAASLAASATLATTQSVAAQSGYDEVVVAAGETKQFAVSSGETLENLLIDVTADGADARIRASGTDWTIRNIGVRGRLEGGFFMNLQGSGRCEHMYLGDGNVSGVSGGGAWINWFDSDGPFSFNEVHMGKLTNNGIYGAPTASDPVAGETHISDSYFNSNNGSQFKIGSETGESTATNCVLRTDGDVTVGKSGVKNPRAMWVLGKTSSSDNVARGKLVGCDIQGEVQWQGDCTITWEDCRHVGFWEHPERTDPPESPPDRVDLTPPAGVPMTPEEGASGTSSSPGGSTSDSEGSDDGSTTPTYDHTIAVLTDSSVQSMSYTLYVTGGATQTTISDTVGAGGNDDIETLEDGRTAIHGFTGNGYGDAYEYNGTVDGFQIDSIEAGDISGVSFEIDGQVVDTQAVVDGTVGDDSTSDPDGSTDDGTTDDGTSDDGSSGSEGSTSTKLIVIDGTVAADETATYQITVSDAISRNADRSSVADGGLPWDSMSDYVGDGTAAGVVGNGVDAFEYTGTLESVSIDGDAEFRLETL